METEPLVARFYLRLALEPAVTWMYSYNVGRPEPYSTKLDSMLHEPS